MASEAKHPRGARRLDWILLLNLSFIGSMQIVMNLVSGVLLGAASIGGLDEREFFALCAPMFMSSLFAVVFGLWLIKRYPQAKRKLVVATVLESMPVLNVLPFFSVFVQPFIWRIAPAGEPAPAKPEGSATLPAAAVKSRKAPAERVSVPLEDFGTGNDGLAEVVKWLVEEGDAVTEGQSLVELAETSRGWAIEIPSPAEGVVATIKAEVGRILRVGQVLLVLEVPEAEALILERELGLFKAAAPRETTAASPPGLPEAIESGEDWKLRKGEEAPQPLAEDETDGESWTLRKEG